MQDLINLYGFWPIVLKGTWVTIQITTITSCIVLVLGLLVAILLRRGHKATILIVKIYTAIFRGVPELLVMLLVYSGSTVALMAIASKFGYDEYIEVSPYIAGIFALSLSYTAYSTEIFRGCFNNLDKGQTEASISLGLASWQSYRFVILPQLWRLALPGLSNLFLILLKDSALVSVIGLSDLMRVSYIGAGATKAPFNFYLVAMLLYLLISVFFTYFFKKLEKSVNKGYSK